MVVLGWIVIGIVFIERNRSCFVVGLRGSFLLLWIHGGLLRGLLKAWAWGFSWFF